MKKFTKAFLTLGISAIVTNVSAQVVTHEDSLAAGLIASGRATVISGYGQAKYQYDARYKTAEANLERVVLFIGHKFNDNISFFSELELEDAKVESGGSSGEISMEQAFLKFNLNRDIYLAAGLIIPRIGIINENHLPTTFNGNDRPYVERLLIPATWRELGVSLYGRSNRIQGLNYTLGLFNGLNASGFESGSGIRGGRFEGGNASASNVAVAGSLLYYVNNFRIQLSSYYGGSAGLSKREADSLQLSYGAFGTPVMLNEANIQYVNKGFSFKTLATIINIPEADKINRAYANNTAKAMIGGYAELGYNVLKLINSATEKNLSVFGRYEYLDLNNKIPENGISNDILKKSFIVGGITYQPLKGVIVKADYVFRTTGLPNPALTVNPFPQAQPYYKTNGFFNLGIGYSF